jgi:hypothetical protein
MKTHYTVGLAMLVGFGFGAVTVQGFTLKRNRKHILSPRPK